MVLFPFCKGPLLLLLDLIFSFASQNPLSVAIPKNIFQTFKTDKLPLITRWHIQRLKKRNPDYEYHFYDDSRIDDFLSKEFPKEFIKAYRRLVIGASKADFFRYAILYKYGGVYLDIDSLIKSKLSDFVLLDDEAIISNEGNPGVYVQWALICAAKHPFLEKTLEVILDNIKTHRHPKNVHATTGPTAFTKAVKTCISQNPDIPYRLMGVDYMGHMKFTYRCAKFFLYGRNRKYHWKKEQYTKDIILSEKSTYPDD